MHARAAVPVLLALAGLVAGCGGREPGADARIAQAVDAIQHGRLEEAARVLGGIRTGGGWLRGAEDAGPLALRLRAWIALRTGTQESSRRLLEAYAGQWSARAPAAWARARLAVLDRFADRQGPAALLYLRGLEAETEAPAVAIREWRTLVRDYPQSAITPAAHLKLGLLQQRLENPTWALADLAAAAASGTGAVDAQGNPVAPQALLATGQIHRDQRGDPAGARTAFETALARHGEAVLRADDGAVEASVGALARLELATLEADGGPALLEAVLEAKPAGYVAAGRIGHARMEARLRLADLALKRRDPEGAKQRWLEALRVAGDLAAGPPAGARRGYAFEIVDALAERLAARSAEAGLAALEAAADAARSRETWAYASLRRVKILARLGRLKEAREIAADLDRRAASLEVDPEGTGLLLVPAREARRTLGG